LTDLLFKGGTVYTPQGPKQADVQVSDGVITRVEQRLAAQAQVVDVSGMYVLPGGVDVHVHSRDPGFPEKEDFASLTSSSAAGGVTFVLDMPNTVPAGDTAGMLASMASTAHSNARLDFRLSGLFRLTR